MARYDTPGEEYDATQEQAEALLLDIALRGGQPTEQELHRLDRLSVNMQRLENASIEYRQVTPQMANLHAWTGHLDDWAWKDRFIAALSHTPLPAPGARLP